MSTDPSQQHEGRQQAPEPGTSRTTPESAEGSETPEAVQAATTRRNREHSGPQEPQRGGRRARGVEWVRPTDLIARQGAALAGRGIDFEVELARRTRRLSVGAAGAHARRLPPASAFGRSSQSESSATRSGIGLG